MEHYKMGDLLIWVIGSKEDSLEVQYSPKDSSWRYTRAFWDILMGETDEVVSFNRADKLYDIPLVFKDDNGSEYYPN